MIRRLGFPGQLANHVELASWLGKTGFSAEARQDKAQHFAQAFAALAELEGDRPAGPVHAFFVPGRIEVLGKHTDYAGGRSMVVATEQGFALTVVSRTDRRVRIVDAVSGQRVEFEIEPELLPAPGHWSNYPMTVARRLARNFPGLSRGADIAFASDLPPAAGMSSSSAMIVAVYLALAEVNQLAQRDEFSRNIRSLLDLAGYLGTVENGETFGTLEGDRGVGTFGGSEDHTAILTAQPGQISQYAYCPVRFQRTIPVPAGHTFVVASSGVVAEKTGSAMEKYNAASRSAWRLVELWRQQTGREEPHLAGALASGPGAAGRLAEILRTAVPEPEQQAALRARLEHFVVEDQQVLPAAGDALARGDLKTFGALVDRSQLAAEQLLGNQVPETCALAASARKLGAAAASAFGAGFGGSVWALVKCRQAERFLARWRVAYERAFPNHQAAFLLAGAGPGAFQVC